MPWEAVLSTDLPALKSPVAGEKALAESVSFIENHRQVIVITQPESRTQQNQRRGNPTALKAGVTDASRHPGTKLDQPFFFYR